MKTDLFAHSNRLRTRLYQLKGDEITPLPEELENIVGEIDFIHDSVEEVWRALLDIASKVPGELLIQILNDEQMDSVETQAQPVLPKYTLLFNQAFMGNDIGLLSLTKRVENAVEENVLSEQIQQKEVHREVMSPSYLSWSVFAFLVMALPVNKDEQSVTIMMNSDLKKSELHL